MTAFHAALPNRKLRRCGSIRAASARSMKIQFTGWADFVEKLRISDVVIFRKEPVRPKSQMRFAMTHSEQPHERQKANLAEPLASKTWSRCTDKNLTDFVKNGVFQQYRL